MSWKSKLEQEYEKETNHKSYNESSEHYNFKYVEWLEAKLDKPETPKTTKKLDKIPFSRFSDTKKNG